MNYLKNLLQGQNVEWKTLGEVCELANTGVDKKVNPDEQKIRLLNFVDVFKNQYINNETPTMVVSANDKKIKDCNILKGDIFITPSSEIIDEIGFSAMAVEDFENAVYSYHIMRLRIKDKEEVFPKYLNYLFQSNNIRKQIKQHAQGITRFGLTQPKWKSLTLPLPPIAVQKEIAHILDTFTQLEAELEAELDCRKRQYHHYRDKLLSFGNEVEWKTLGEIGEFVRGTGLQKSDFTEQGVPAIHYGQIYTKYGNSTAKTISFVSEELAKKLRKASKNDLIIAGVSENIEDICKCVVWKGEEDVCVSGDTFIFKHNQNADYIAHLLRTNDFLNYKKKYAVGAKVTRLQAGSLPKYKIPIPPLAEQQRIAGILDQFDRLVNDISEGIPAEIIARRKQYEYYREQLLSFNQ